MKLGRGHIGGYLERWRREIGSRYFLIIVYKILNIEKVIIKIHSKKKKYKRWYCCRHIVVLQ